MQNAPGPDFVLKKNENIVSKDPHKWTLEKILIEIMIYLW